jgi:hypothetical protein
VESRFKRFPSSSGLNVRRRVFRPWWIYPNRKLCIWTNHEYDYLCPPVLSCYGHTSCFVLFWCSPQPAVADRPICPSSWPLVTGWVEVDIDDTIANQLSPDLSKALVGKCLFTRTYVDQEFNDFDCEERGRKRTNDVPDKKHIGFSSVQTRWGDTRTTVNGHSAATAAELNHSPKYTQSFALTGPLSSQNSKLGQAVHGAWDHPEIARSGLIARYT